MLAHELLSKTETRTPPSAPEDARAHVETLLQGGVRVWDWDRLGELERRGLFAYLGAFVDDFNARYGENEPMRIPACWREHRALVEEITTLAASRFEAFSSDNASIGAAQQWHTYTLPAFYERMRFWLGVQALYCMQGQHRSSSDGGAADHPEDGDPAEVDAR